MLRIGAINHSPNGPSEFSTEIKTIGALMMSDPTLPYSVSLFRDTSDSNTVMVSPFQLENTKIAQDFEKY